MMKEATNASISLTTLFEDVAEMAWDVKDAVVASSLTGWYNAVVTCLVPALDDCFIGLNNAFLAWLGSACLDVKEAVVASLTGLYDAIYPVPLVLSVQLERAGVELSGMRRTMMKEATNASMMKEATNASISLTTLFEDVVEMAWDVKDAAVASLTCIDDEGSATMVGQVHLAYSFAATGVLCLIVLLWGFNRSKADSFCVKFAGICAESSRGLSGMSSEETSAFVDSTPADIEEIFEEELHEEEEDDMMEKYRPTCRRSSRISGSRK